MLVNFSNGYGNDYSEEGFWKKVKKYALKAGKEVIEKALMLFYCLQEKDTPKWAKGVIVAALGYFVCPMDAIPDPTPVVGYADDLGVLVAALATVSAYIKEEHKQKAKETLKRWFGSSE